MIVSCYYRRTCDMVFFQGYRFPGAFNYVYKRVVSNEHIEMRVVPREMRRAQGKSKMRQADDDGCINRSMAQSLVTITMF